MLACLLEGGKKACKSLNSQLRPVKPLGLTRFLPVRLYGFLRLSVTFVAEKCVELKICLPPPW